MSVDAEVRHELMKINGDKAKLMQQYSDRMKEILIPYGGNLSDMPMDPNHEYHQLQKKVMCLGKLV